VVTEGGDRLEDGGRVVLPGDRPQGRGGRGQKARQGGGLFGWLFGKKDAGQGAGPARSAELAAGPGGPGRGGDRTARMIQELGLDAQQKAKAEAIFAAAREQAGEDPGARRQAMRQAMDQLEPILRPDQKQKLAQVRTRMSGGGNRSGG
jgi:Spy/CpxP family protein refolding chaperone